MHLSYLFRISQYSSRLIKLVWDWIKLFKLSNLNYFHWRGDGLLRVSAPTTWLLSPQSAYTPWTRGRSALNHFFLSCRYHLRHCLHYCFCKRQGQSWNFFSTRWLLKRNHDFCVILGEIWFLHSTATRGEKKRKEIWSYLCKFHVSIAFFVSAELRCREPKKMNK